MKMEDLGNEMSIGYFENLEHTPGNLEGHIACGLPTGPRGNLNRC